MPKFLFYVIIVKMQKLSIFCWALFTSLSGLSYATSVQPQWSKFCLQNNFEICFEISKYCEITTGSGFSCDTLLEPPLGNLKFISMTTSDNWPTFTENTIQILSLIYLGNSNEKKIKFISLATSHNWPTFSENTNWFNFFLQISNLLN